MAKPQDEELSRAVSSLDLNAALTASQNEPRNGRYTKEELLSLRPEESGDVEKHVEQVGVAKVGSDGVTTPPTRICPNPPPPTPEVITGSPTAPPNLTGGQLIKDEEYGLRVAGEEPKKATKKSSGKNKNAATGFEGLDRSSS
jgi:hypothetical protein